VLSLESTEAAKADILKSIQSTFNEAIFSALTGQKVVISQDISALTKAISAESCSSDEEAKSSDEEVKSSVTTMNSSFISIHEAVSFIQPLSDSFIIPTIEGDELPAIEEEDDDLCVIEDDDDLPGLTGATTLYESLEFTSILDETFDFSSEESGGSDSGFTDSTDYQQDAPLSKPLPLSPVNTTIDTFIPYSTCIQQPSLLSITIRSVVFVSTLYMLAFL
jgi:hypothetical protein